MKKYSIYISGYGAEVSIGTLTPEQVEILNNEISKGTTMTTIVWEEMLGKSSYELDDLYHNWGCGDVFSVVVEDENKQVIFECTEKQLYTDSNLFEFQDKYIDSTEPMVMSVSGEKGVFFESIIECDNFDLDKLKISIDSEVGIPNYFYGDMISKICYDGEELYNIGGSTDGKYFEAGTNLEIAEKEKNSQVMKCESYLLYLSQNLERISQFIHKNDIDDESVLQSTEKISNSIDDLLNQLENLGFNVSEIHSSVN